MLPLSWFFDGDGWLGVRCTPNASFFLDAAARKGRDWSPVLDGMFSFSTGLDSDDPLQVFALAFLGDFGSSGSTQGLKRFLSQNW